MTPFSARPSSEINVKENTEMMPTMLAEAGNELLVLSDGGELERYLMSAWPVHQVRGAGGVVARARACAVKTPVGEIIRVKSNYAIASTEGFASEAEWLAWARASQAQTRQERPDVRP
jgi:hypothetical protein